MPELDPEEAVRVLDVSKKYLSGSTYVDVLRKISFVARKGKITMITGPSGSGKTTLLCVIASILRYDEGTVHVLGHELGTLSADECTEFRKANIGFIFQQFNLVKRLTVRENVLVGRLGYHSALAGLFGLYNAEDHRLTEQYLNEVGLQGRFSSRVDRLSGGQPGRVA